jgi:hypothetical protein
MEKYNRAREATLTMQYGARALHDGGYRRLRTPYRNIYTLFFHGVGRVAQSV